MIEGESGILAACPPWNMPTYEMATSRLTWPGGQVAHLVTAEAPDRIRGFNFDFCWADEVTSWQDAENTWNQVQLALRLTGPRGDPPRTIVTSTPKNTPLMRKILALPGVAVTRASSYDNTYLNPDRLAQWRAQYEGTTLGRQEIYGELLIDDENALWTRSMLDACRVKTAPEMRRIVVAVDPSGGGKDECGIVVCGLGVNGEAYILQDLSAKLSPERWARRAVEAFHAHRADRIVAEQNFGGQMVEATIRSVDPNVPIRMVHASRGKQIRAEPVVALYEQRRVHHVGEFVELEDQLCSWSPTESTSSPDRLDSVVWGVSELMLGNQPRPAYRTFIPFMGR